MYLTNQRFWGCIICCLIHQVINYYLLQIVYASSLCTLLQPVSVSSLDKDVLYCLIQAVYVSSLFISHLSIMNHGFWGCILRLHNIHLVIYCPIRTAGHQTRSSIHMLSILCFSAFQDQATTLVLSLLQQTAYKHRSVLQILNPTSSLLMEPCQSTCCSQDKLFTKWWNYIDFEGIVFIIIIIFYVIFISDTAYCFYIINAINIIFGIDIVINSKTRSWTSWFAPIYTN